ncbi:hypothetical protein LTR28_008546, partial [Elasticomyces elasticus]
MSDEDSLCGDLDPIPKRRQSAASMKSFISQDSGYSSPSTSSSASARKHNNEASSPDGSRPLRRRLSPRQSSLREIRMRQSEAQLQRVYEEQTLNYLDDKIDFSPYFEYKSIVG